MCLDDQMLSSYIDGELQEPWKTQVEEHISHCTDCRGRYEQLARLDQMLYENRLRNDEFSAQQQRVWKYLEKTCMPSQPKKFKHKRFAFSAPTMAAAAAAFVVILGANVFFIRGVIGDPGDEQPIPTLTAEVQQVPNGMGDEPVIGVSARTHRTSSIAPQELSVDELLFLLEQKGFEVELKRSDSMTPVQSYGASPAAQQDSQGTARFEAEQEPEETTNDDPEAESDGWSDWDEY